MMKSDAVLKQEIENELRWEPSINKAHIGVRVSNGVVTLFGHVPRLAEKVTAEKAVKRLYAVKGVVNDLNVHLPGGLERTDDDLVVACENALDAYYCIPKDKVKVRVLDGWVTLEGEVDWNFQKDDASAAVHKLIGVRGINNNIAVKQHFAPEDMNRRILEALQRNADIDAGQIRVQATDGSVILSGTVRSCLEKDTVQQAAAAVVGVTSVDNQLTIEPNVQLTR